MALTAEDILKTGASGVHKVDVPGIGSVYVRDVTGEDMDYLRQRNGEDTENAILARHIIVGICDEDGKPLFGRNDLEKLNQRKLSTLRPLAEAVVQNSGMVPEDMKELLGNSATTTQSDSGTG